MMRNTMIGTAEIAGMLGVTREHVTDKLTKRPDFPAPVVNISRKLRRWDEAEVQRWMQGKPVSSSRTNR